MQIQQSNVTYANVPLFMGNVSNATQGLAGLTLTVTVSKQGGAFGNGGGSVTDRGNGVYFYTPIAGNLDTLGLLTIRAAATGAIDFLAERQIVAFDPVNDPAGLSLANGVETGTTVRQALRAMAAVLAGNVSGAGTAEETFEGIGVSTTRVTNAGNIAGDRDITLNL